MCITGKLFELGAIIGKIFGVEHCNCCSTIYQQTEKEAQPLPQDSLMTLKQIENNSKEYKKIRGGISCLQSDCIQFLRQNGSSQLSQEEGEARFASVLILAKTSLHQLNTRKESIIQLERSKDPEEGFDINAMTTLRQYALQNKEIKLIIKQVEYVARYGNIACYLWQVFKHYRLVNEIEVKSYVASGDINPAFKRFYKSLTTSRKKIDEVISFANLDNLKDLKLFFKAAKSLEKKVTKEKQQGCLWLDNVSAELMPSQPEEEMIQVEDTGAGAFAPIAMIRASRDVGTMGPLLTDFKQVSPACAAYVKVLSQSREEKEQQCIGLLKLQTICCLLNLDYKVIKTSNDLKKHEKKIGLKVKEIQQRSNAIVHLFIVIKNAREETLKQKLGEEIYQEFEQYTLSAVNFFEDVEKAASIIELPAQQIAILEQIAGKYCDEELKSFKEYSWTAKLKLGDMT